MKSINIARNAFHETDQSLFNKGRNKHNVKSKNSTNNILYTMLQMTWKENYHIERCKKLS